VASPTGAFSYQEETIGLYRRSGFTEVDCFGEYTGVPTSLCFEKWIGDPISSR
jgi:hypothetical protein